MKVPGRVTEDLAAPPNCRFYHESTPGQDSRFVGYLPRKRKWFTEDGGYQNWTSRRYNPRLRTKELAQAYVHNFLFGAQANGVLDGPDPE